MIYLLQEQEHRCGEIALRHLLSLLKHERSYLQVALNLSDHASFAELQSKAQAFGVSLVGFHVQNPACYRSVRKPFISLVKVSSRTHYIVVARANRKRVLIVDGTREPYWLSWSEYILQSSGYILVVKSFLKKRLHLQSPFPLMAQNRFLMTLLYVLSIVFLLLGLYLIDVEVSFSIPIVSLCLAFILIIIQSRCLRKAMIHFDEETVKYLQAIDTSLEFTAFHQFKQLLFSKTITWLNHWLIVMIGTTIIIINDLYNLITLFIVCTLVTLSNAIMRPRLRRGMVHLTHLEDELFTHRDNHREHLKAIHRLSYQLADITLFGRVVIIAVIMMTSLLFMALRGHVYLNYFLFQAASYYFIIDNWLSLVNFNERDQLYYQLYFHFFLR